MTTNQLCGCMAVLAQVLGPCIEEFLKIITQIWTSILDMENSLPIFYGNLVRASNQKDKKKKPFMDRKTTVFVDMARANPKSQSWDEEQYTRFKLFSKTKFNHDQLITENESNANLKIIWSKCCKLEFVD